MQVSATVGGSSFYEVTFYAKTGNGAWTSIGTDDSAPYRVFHDVSALSSGQNVQYRAVVLDNARHTATSQEVAAAVPAPTLTIEAPAEGSNVRGTVEVRTIADRIAWEPRLPIPGRALRPPFAAFFRHRHRRLRRRFGGGPC